jgi:hypothetical protein
MIITDDDFATIIDAVEEGRGIYANIRKTLQYLLAGNTGELLLMTVCVIIGLPTPLLPIHRELSVSLRIRLWCANQTDRVTLSDAWQAGSPYRRRYHSRSCG